MEEVYYQMIQGLPPEIGAEVLRYIPTEELYSFREVSRAGRIFAEKELERRQRAGKSLTDFPVEILVHEIILPYLDVSEFLHLCKTHSQLSDLCKNEYVWKHLVFRDFGEPSFVSSSWKKTYLISHKVNRLMKNMKHSYVVEFSLQDLPSPEIFEKIPGFWFFVGYFLKEYENAQTSTLPIKIFLYFRLGLLPLPRRPHFELLLQKPLETGLKWNISKESMKQVLFYLYDHFPEILRDGTVEFYSTPISSLRFGGNIDTRTGTVLGITTLPDVLF